MQKETLKIISDAMDSLGINYDFMEWAGKASYPYFVGEYQEITPQTESGEMETTFILTGFARGKDAYIELENAKKKIEYYFSKVSGKTVIAESGSAVAVFYANSLVIPTVDAELKKLQINLTIKEWSVI